MKADPTLPQYLGSTDAANGLVLVWLGLPCLIGGTIFAFTAGNEIPVWISGLFAVWGLIAIVTGLPLRRTKPTNFHSHFAKLLLAIAAIGGLAALITG